MHTYMHTYIHTYLHTYIHTYMYLCLIYIYPYVCIHIIRLYIYIYTYICIYTTYISIYIYICIYIFTYIYISIRIYLYIYIQVYDPLPTAGIRAMLPPSRSSWSMSTCDRFRDRQQNSGAPGGSVMIINGGCPLPWGYPNSWMVYFRENPMKIDDLRVALVYPCLGLRKPAN